MSFMAPRSAKSKNILKASLGFAAVGTLAIGALAFQQAVWRERRQHRLLFVGVIFMVLLTGPAWSADAYRINAGDLLSVQVYGEDDMSLPKVRVGSGGKISMPLLGEIVIVDLGIGEVERKITDMLLDGYLKKPKVTVSVLEYRMFYVTGQVRNPGGYNYIVGLTVRKAIAIAGGLTVRGSESKLNMIQENQDGMEVQVKMEAGMGPGDILNVGESFF